MLRVTYTATVTRSTRMTAVVTVMVEMLACSISSVVWKAFWIAALFVFRFVIVTAPRMTTKPSPASSGATAICFLMLTFFNMDNSSFLGHRLTALHLAHDAAGVEDEGDLSVVEHRRAGDEREGGEELP